LTRQYVVELLPAGVFERQVQASTVLARVAEFVDAGRHHARILPIAFFNHSVDSVGSRVASVHDAEDGFVAGIFVVSSPQSVSNVDV